MSILITIASLSVVVPFLVCIFLYKRLPVACLWLAWLFTFWLTAEVCANLLRFQHIPNWSVYALLRLAEIVIVTMFYKKIFISHKARTTSVWAAWVGIAVAVVEYANTGGASSTVTVLYEGTFFIGMGLYACYEMITMNAPVKYLLVNACLMALYLGSAVYLSTWQFLKYDVALFKLFGDAHAYLLITCYSLFTIALWRLQA